MAQTHTHPLQLADLHLPALPDPWPLAWGWWASALLIIILLTLLYLVVSHLKVRRNLKAGKNQALAQLKRAQSVSEINTLLRQAALTYFPREQVAGLSGHHWMAFLDHQLPEQHQGFVSLNDAWTQALYASKVGDDIHNACRHQAEIWLRHALPPRSPQHTPAMKRDAAKGDRHV
ncbi:DUF4381 domain-containing protein [Photobacterium halotolerans]|uniref:DUF4381 family protein n=1 Tax=Photobacterium halotolerans TaxID=265726 RepID=A0A7X4Y2U2_9GAMM|nr:DUF4381 domain-containing protein [Photobacterium halotolerans]NAW64151.1 DUF4381 family protein [Photobacterium halotolerans]NAW88826.1 DUF4381 family protein [Photobacterium halotolerans]NAX49021.1 DUF4381 family protein [Photobacterium halotolerans]